MAKNNNYPAFPVTAYAGDGKNPPVKPNTGMSVRDFFAAMALLGYRASGAYTAMPSSEIAAVAYDDADAMLRQREYI